MVVEIAVVIDAMSGFQRSDITARSLVAGKGSKRYQASHLFSPGVRITFVIGIPGQRNGSLWKSFVVLGARAQRHIIIRRQYALHRFQFRTLLLLLLPWRAYGWIKGRMAQSYGAGLVH